MHYIGDSQCFPLYWYEENKNKQRSLFDEESNDDYIRRDGITDWILKEVRTRYGAKNITKEMIFYYVYGLLHSKDYRERFAADLKKSLPRIPIVDSLDDFMEFYKAGKELADLHLNYETVAPYPGVIVHGDRQVPLTVKRDPATGGYIQAPADDGAYDYFRVIDREHPTESLRVYRQRQIGHRMDRGALRRHPGQEVAHQERCQRLGP